MSNPTKVLVVDDDRDWLDLMMELLRREGYLVQGASSGAQALSLLVYFAPTVVMTDLRMPLMDGSTLLLQLQAHHPSVRIVVVTGDRNGAAAAVLGAAFDIVEKSAPLDRLLSAIASAAAAQPLRPEETAGDQSK